MVYEYQVALLSHLIVQVLILGIMIYLFYRSHLRIYLIISVGALFLSINDLIVLLTIEMKYSNSIQIYAYSYMFVILSYAIFYAISRNNLPKNYPHIFDIIFATLFTFATVDILHAHVTVIYQNGVEIPIGYGSTYGAVAMAGMVVIFLGSLLYGIYRKMEITIVRTRRNFLLALTIFGTILMTLVVVNATTHVIPMPLYYHMVNFILLILAFITMIDPYIAIYMGQNIKGFFYLDISTNHMFTYNTKIYEEQDWGKIRFILSAYIDEMYSLKSKTKEISVNGEKIYLFYNCNRIFGVLGDQINTDAKNIIKESLEDLCAFLESSTKLPRQEKLEIIEKNLNRKIIYRLL
ncbi:MAG: hypothetical protein ACP6IP_08285 [Candidatus Njordarchaeia archaeon]